MLGIDKQKKLQWTEQEIQLLRKNANAFSSKKWKKLSQLFHSHGYSRSQIQIRERWTNFEDPKILFTDWTDQELLTLYESYRKFGSKWCLVKKTLPGRTENKIKNKFYGNIRIYLRFVVNYFSENKEQSLWVHKINPTILNDIYNGSREFVQVGPQLQRSMEKMGYKVEKIELLQMIEQNYQLYYKLYQKILKIYLQHSRGKKNLENISDADLNEGQPESREPDSKVEKLKSNEKKSETPLEASQLVLNNTTTGAQYPNVSPWACQNAYYGTFNSTFLPFGLPQLPNLHPWEGFFFNQK